MDMTFTKLMVDTAHGVNAENYSAADSTEAIRNRFREVLGVAADCSRKEMHRRRTYKSCLPWKDSICRIKPAW